MAPVASTLSWMGPAKNFCQPNTKRQPQVRVLLLVSVAAPTQQGGAGIQAVAEFTRLNDFFTSREDCDTVVSDYSIHDAHAGIEEIVWRLKCFFDLPDDCLKVVAYVGLGRRGSGSWALRDGDLSFDRVLDLWLQRERQDQQGRLFVYSDSCYSGHLPARAAARADATSNVFVQASCGEGEKSWGNFTALWLQLNEEEKTAAEVLEELECPHPQVRLAGTHPVSFSPRPASHLPECALCGLSLIASEADPPASAAATSTGSDNMSANVESGTEVSDMKEAWDKLWCLAAQGLTVGRVAFFFKEFHQSFNFGDDPSQWEKKMLVRLRDLGMQVATQWLGECRDRKAQMLQFLDAQKEKFEIMLKEEQGRRQRRGNQPRQRAMTPMTPTTTATTKRASPMIAGCRAEDIPAALWRGHESFSDYYVRNLLRHCVPDHLAAICRKMAPQQDPEGPTPTQTPREPSRLRQSCDGDGDGDGDGDHESWMQEPKYIKVPLQVPVNELAFPRGHWSRCNLLEQSTKTNSQTDVALDKSEDRLPCADSAQLLQYQVKQEFSFPVGWEQQQQPLLWTEPGPFQVACPLEPVTVGCEGLLAAVRPDAKWKRVVFCERNTGRPTGEMVKPGAKTLRMLLEDRLGKQTVDDDDPLRDAIHFVRRFRLTDMELESDEPGAVAMARKQVVVRAAEEPLTAFALRRLDDCLNDLIRDIIPRGRKKPQLYLLVRECETNHATTDSCAGRGAGSSVWTAHAGDARPAQQDSEGPAFQTRPISTPSRQCEASLRLSDGRAALLYPESEYDCLLLEERNTGRTEDTPSLYELLLQGMGSIRIESRRCLHQQGLPDAVVYSRHFRLEEFVCHGDKDDHNRRWVQVYPGSEKLTAHTAGRLLHALSIILSEVVDRRGRTPEVRICTKKGFPFPRATGRGVPYYSSVLLRERTMRDPWLGPSTKQLLEFGLKLLAQRCQANLQVNTYGGLREHEIVRRLETYELHELLHNLVRQGYNQGYMQESMRARYVAVRGRYDRSMATQEAKELPELLRAPFELACHRLAIQLEPDWSLRIVTCLPDPPIR